MYALVKRRFGTFRVRESESILQKRKFPSLEPEGRTHRRKTTNEKSVDEDGFEKTPTASWLQAASMFPNK